MLSDMDISATLALYDRFERREAQAPGFRLEPAPGVVRQLGEAGQGSMILWSGLDEAGADAVIEREKAFFTALGGEVEWKLYSHDRPVDLRDRLASRGFAIGEDEALMAIDLEDWSPGPESAPGIEIRRITAPEGLSDMVPVSLGVWGEDPSDQLAAFRSILEKAPRHMSFYIAYAEGQAVSFCRISFPEASPFAGLWGGSTLEAYRGRGIYSAFLQIRAREARERGYRYLTIDASPMSRPIVARRGFQLLAITNPCTFEGRKP